MTERALRLGKGQFAILEVLWDLGAATARQITDELCKTRFVAHSTVQTLLRQLEGKGAVKHDINDRTFVFQAAVPRTQTIEVVTHQVLTSMFGGSVYSLIAHLLQHEKVSSNDIDRLRALLDETAKG